MRWSVDGGGRLSWLGEEAGVEIMYIVESFCLVTSRLCRALLELERDLDP